MPPPATERRPLASAPSLPVWVASLLSLAFGCWRLVLAIGGKNSDEPSSGAAKFKHQHLIVVQGVLAIIGAIALVYTAEQITARETAAARRGSACAAIAIAASLVIFAKHGLGNVGAYES